MTYVVFFLPIAAQRKRVFRVVGDSRSICSFVGERRRRRGGRVVATCATSKITTRNKRTPIDDAAALFFLLTSEHGDGITGQIRCAHKQTNKQTNPSHVAVFSFLFLLLLLWLFVSSSFSWSRFSCLCLIYNFLHCKQVIFSV